MFKLVWARSRGRGRTHRPGPGSGRLGKREAAAGRSHGGRSAEGERGAVASLLCSHGVGGRGTRRGLGAWGRGVRRGFPAGRSLRLRPPRFTFWGRRGGAPPDRRPRVCLLRLAGWAGRRRGAQTGFPRRAPSSPGPAPSELARGGPRPAPRPLAPSGRAARQPRAPPRPWLRGRDGCAHACPRPRSAARSLARSAARRRSGLPAPARRYSPRRRIVPSEEAARERPRASSARGRHLVAAALPRILAGAVRGGGAASAGATGRAWSCASPAAMQLPRASSSPESRGCSGNCKA